ncbi:MAG TPA: hypothetical protein VG100_04640 [Xanthobacteraceae bacterium]|jgi:hypothetical protein|nr:hypothetical protein [Xanthobacteraceae bacterium]
MTTHSSLFFIESHSIDLSQDVAACSCLIFAGIRSRLLRRIHCRAPQLTGIYRRWDRFRTIMCCTASSAALVFRLIFTSAASSSAAAHYGTPPVFLPDITSCRPGPAGFPW